MHDFKHFRSHITNEVLKINKVNKKRLPSFINCVWREILALMSDRVLWVFTASSWDGLCGPGRHHWALFPRTCLDPLFLFALYLVPFHMYIFIWETGIKIPALLTSQRFSKDRIKDWVLRAVQKHWITLSGHGPVLCKCRRKKLKHLSDRQNLICDYVVKRAVHRDRAIGFQKTRDADVHWTGCDYTSPRDSLSALQYSLISNPNSLCDKTSTCFYLFFPHSHPPITLLLLSFINLPAFLDLGYNTESRKWVLG